jgi:site-specific DNA-methyltransferase (adenine-specific)
MKPLVEKTYVDQALANGHGVTWLDDGRIPYKSEDDKKSAIPQGRITTKDSKSGIGAVVGGINNIELDKDEWIKEKQIGRFPANLLCSDDVLNDGVDRKSGQADVGSGSHKKTFNDRYAESAIYSCYADTGSFSRFFSLDSWWDNRIKQLPESVQKTFPFILVPKASKSEKNKGCEGLEEKPTGSMVANEGDIMDLGGASLKGDHKQMQAKANHHPTVKPIKLFSYLITLGSREGDLILDPFVGSGTSCVSAKILNRHWIGIERESEYVTIAEKRLQAEKQQMEFSLAGG